MYYKEKKMSSLACDICGSSEEYVCQATNKFRITLNVCEHCAPGGFCYDDDAWTCDCPVDQCNHIIPSRECEKCGILETVACQMELHDGNNLWCWDCIDAACYEEKHGQST